MRFNFVPIRDFLIKRSPEILTGVGIAGFISATIMAIKATPRAMQRIEDRCEAEQVDTLSKWEAIKTALPSYIPTITATALSAGAVICGQCVSLRRNASLAVAASLAEATLQEYRARVVDYVGEEKARDISQEVSRTRAEALPAELPVSEQKVILTGLGNQLCLDQMSGRYFKCDANRIDKAVNTFNRDLRDELFLPLNHFYSMIGLPSSDGGVGDILGIDLDRGYLDVTYTSALTDTNEPVLVLTYDIYPITTYEAYKNK